MTDITYDPGADAVYIYLGNGEIDRQEEAGPFIYDVDTGGRIIGIESYPQPRFWRPAIGETHGDQTRQALTPRSESVRWT
jgi:uncharacterized protein YuzE